EEIQHDFWVGRTRSRHAFTDHPHGGPSLHVACRHSPRELPHEAVLQLYRAPLVVRGVPARWNEAGGPCDRPRIPRPVRQIGRKNLAFVRCHENIVGGRSLRENRQLALNLYDALSVLRAPPVSSNTLSWTIRAPNRLAERRSASPKSLSSAWEPTTKSHLRHCFQTRYCARASASIDRVGAV